MASDEPLHTYERYIHDDSPDIGYIYFADNVFRLRWPAFGPPSSIMILDDATDPNSTQSPFYNADGTVHPISESPISHPPVSSIKVVVRDLNLYADQNREEFCETEECPGEWPEGTPLDVEARIPYHCTCPDAYNPPLPIQVVGTGPQGAVTIGDYVRLVGPWLRNLETEIRHALEECSPIKFPPEGGEKCYVVTPIGADIDLEWDEAALARRWKSAADWAKKQMENPPWE